MDKINKRKLSKEQTDELIDILNNIDESDTSKQEKERGAHYNFGTISNSGGLMEL